VTRDGASEQALLEQARHSPADARVIAPPANLGRRALASTCANTQARARIRARAWAAITTTLPAVGRTLVRPAAPARRLTPAATSRVEPSRFSLRVMIMTRCSNTSCRADRGRLSRGVCVVLEHVGGC
jgi:hypothetical protein